MSKRWSILYRGSLSSCNYGCDYCPFAKTKNTREELAQDKAELDRFTQWAINRKEKIGILFTPWGEGLIRKHYQQAMTELSWAKNISKVAIQTNLSCPTQWMEKVNKETFALWATYHPTQISLEKFAKKCIELEAMNIRYSVGFVGFKEDLDMMEKLRSLLPNSVYLWVNANKKDPNYYAEEDFLRIERTDPYFRTNTVYHKSAGEACMAGHSVFSVDGEGNMTRCHFIKQRIGNIYDADFEDSLYQRPCSNNTCGCHIGYVHMDKLKQYNLYGEGVLERIPDQWNYENIKADA
ncbi:STM4011 family radical SAM protein [Fulvivirga sediminis]|uniref:STM4011 family radical SAM protein n=1 Tax=Fulvivirga sediminis TaxID=2803949 RepID=A0A937F4P9_9BACT|nr:STM4011 family radical SAM protein [Fulvivirga sediminis]MBL3656346.1 STM4011 family radical SAM protein [Fulvivirga sediminis]